MMVHKMNLLVYYVNCLQYELFIDGLQNELYGSLCELIGSYIELVWLYA